MISPDVKPYELEQFLPLMPIEEMEEYVKKINDLLKTETDAAKKLRLLENRGILEKAIKNY